MLVLVDLIVYMHTAVNLRASAAQISLYTDRTRLSVQMWRQSKKKQMFILTQQRFG